MRKIIFATALSFLCLFSTAQNVGIGTITPITKLMVTGASSNPQIPAVTSSAIFRIGVLNEEGIDFGKMGLPSFAGWIQSGYQGSADPLVLQAAGGYTGIGTANPTNILSVAGNTDIMGSMSIGSVTTNPSAQLDISSTTKGFLPPRLTISQRNAISNTAIGLVIFCTDCDELQVFNGTIWKSMDGRAACINPSLPNVTICNQVWMQKNLDVDRYRNGDLIPQVTDPTAWSSVTTGAWCYYNNDPINGITYGKLYNWYALNDPRGLAPVGWHVPSDVEWTTLISCLGGVAIAGGKMKSITIWPNPNTGATNSSGFTGLPGGFRYLDGSFEISRHGNLWSSTEESPYIVYRILDYQNAIAGRSAQYKNAGISVRCVAD